MISAQNRKVGQVGIYCYGISRNRLLFYLNSVFGRKWNIYLGTLQSPSHTMQACQSSCLRGGKSQQRNYKTCYLFTCFQTTSIGQVICYIRNSGNIWFSWKLVDMCKDHLQPEAHMEKLLVREEKELSSSKLKRKKEFQKNSLVSDKWTLDRGIKMSSNANQISYL